MRFFQFIFSHSVFIACCAAALCFQTNILLHTAVDEQLYCFIFFSTLCSYNFYWLLSKFYFSDRGLNIQFVKKHFSFFAFFIAAAACASFFLFHLLPLLPYIFAGGVLMIAYSLPLWPFAFTKRLQRAGFFKTTLLAMAWAYITVIIPAVPLLHTALLPVISLLITRFFFMLLLCIIFDMRDISVDKMHGLHSLATDLRQKHIDLIIGFVILFYLAGGFFVRNYFHDNRQLIAFAVTALTVWVVFRASLKPRGYLFYYFLVDGLMLLSALFSFAAGRL